MLLYLLWKLLFLLINDCFAKRPHFMSVKPLIEYRFMFQTLRFHKCIFLLCISNHNKSTTRGQWTFKEGLIYLILTSPKIKFLICILKLYTYNDTKTAIETLERAIVIDSRFIIVICYVFSILNTWGFHTAAASSCCCIWIMWAWQDSVCPLNKCFLY